MSLRKKQGLDQQETGGMAWIFEQVRWEALSGFSTMETVETARQCAKRLDPEAAPLGNEKAFKAFNLGPNAARQTVLGEFERHLSGLGEGEKVPELLRTAFRTHVETCLGAEEAVSLAGPRDVFAATRHLWQGELGLGVGPHALRKGDLVVVLQGCEDVTVLLLFDRGTNTMSLSGGIHTHTGR